MGIYIGLALILAVAGTNVFTWAVAARVRLRREAQTPYRGGKLGTGEWKESCGEALAATPTAFWLYGTGVLVIMAAIFGLGLVTSELQDRVTEAASAEEAAAVEEEQAEEQAAEPREDELSKMLRCRQALDSLPDPRVDLNAYWDTVNDHVEWQGGGCGFDRRAPLDALTPEEIVRGLDSLDPIVTDDEYFDSATRGWEADFLRLVSRRDREDDRAALIRRLYGRGNPDPEYILPQNARETRRRYLILAALDNAEADGQELRQALVHMSQYRFGDNSNSSVVTRLMALDMLQRRQQQDKDEAASPDRTDAATD